MSEPNQNAAVMGTVILRCVAICNLVFIPETLANFILPGGANEPELPSYFLRVGVGMVVFELLTAFVLWRYSIKWGKMLARGIE